MKHRLFGGVLFSLAIALACSPLLLVDAADGGSVDAGVSRAAAIAPTVDVPPDAAAVLAHAGRSMGIEELGDVDLIDQTAGCEGYNGNCEPVVTCSLDNLQLEHNIDAVGINIEINGLTTCDGGRLEFRPIVGEEIITTLTIRGVKPGSIELKGTLDPGVCLLGANVRFEIKYIKGVNTTSVGVTDEVPLAICTVK